MDVIAATGEQVTAALTAIAIQAEGGKARSLLGHQVKILTDGAFTKARIKTIEGSKIFSTVKKGQIAVVAGFQGVDEHGNITTLGRGGSDTTAVAIAAAIGADACEIYTDVDGVYTTDPNICPSARKIPRISYEEMLELASLGAKVLQIRSVEIAMKYGVPVHVRSSFSDAQGTWVTGEDKSLEDVVVAGVAYDKNEARVHVVGLDDKPGVVAELFGALADKNISVDMIIQNASTERRRPRRRHVHARRRPTSPRAKPFIEEVAQAPRRPGGPLRRGHREGLDRRPRHALARRHRREDVPHPRRRGHQHPGDLDERDQGQLPRPRRSTRSSPCARSTTASGSASSHDAARPSAGRSVAPHVFEAQQHRRVRRVRGSSS